MLAFLPPVNTLLLMWFVRNFEYASESFPSEVSPLFVEPTGLDREKRDVRQEFSAEGHSISNTDQNISQNLVQAMQSVNFWILFVSMACGMGSGLATVNNIGQIGGSLGYTSHETGTLVSLWSIWNFIGRFGAGYVSDYFLHTRYSRYTSHAVSTLSTPSPA